ncbi:MAG: VOC family protein [Acidobacteriaceae bacterium]|nr:VOC family protein [Acidobacteriaceae bacterium]
MSVAERQPITFLPTNKPEQARRFYEETLGLSFVADDGFALVFRGLGGLSLRLVRVGKFTPLPFTVAGWETGELEADVERLSARGVHFEDFGLPEQDERGIWTAPNGNKVAWFKDPDGNMLSLSQHT